MNGLPVTRCRRIVLHLRPGADAELLRVAAELARLLDIGVHGLLVEDEALLSLAALPFAREIRLPTFDWHRLDLEEMARDLRQSAARLRQALDEAARGAGVPVSFETLRGARAPEGPYRAGDVVIAAEAGRAGQLPAMDVWAAAPGTGLTLLIPARPRRQQGLFAAVAATGGEAVLDIACRFALAAHEGLILLAEPGEGGALAAAHAMGLGLHRDRIHERRIRSAAAADIVVALTGLRQRLLVMPPPEMPEDAWAIATSLGVPVLLVE